MMFPSLAIALVVTVFAAIEQVQTKLIHAQVMFRHGERSPIIYVPFEVENKKPYVGEDGELLPCGAAHEYALGKQLRKRYKNFMDSKTVEKHRSWLNAISTSKNRTSESGQAVLAGFYKPSKAFQVSTRLKWAPLAMHDNTVILLNNVFPSSSRCPGVKNRMKTDENIQKIVDKHKPVIDYMQQHTGLGEEIRNIFGYTDVLGSLQTINDNNDPDHPAPDWALKGPVADYEHNQKEVIYEIYENVEWQKELQCGFTYGLVLRNILDYMNNNTKNKMIFLSSHDWMLAQLQIALDVPESEITRKRYGFYGAHFIIEAHQDGTAPIEIRVLYGKSYNHKAERVTMNKCPEPCTLDKFSQIMTPVSVEGLKAACAATNSRHRRTNEHDPGHHHRSRNDCVIRGDTEHVIDLQRAVAALGASTAAFAIAFMVTLVALCRVRRRDERVEMCCSGFEAQPIANRTKAIIE